MVLLFLLVCFRNRDTLLLLLLPVLFGTLFGLTAMYFLKGQFSLLALGIGAVALGVAMSYVLHVLTHYKYVGNPEQVLREQAKPVCLGCLTTIGSFMGLIFIDTVTGLRIVCRLCYHGHYNLQPHLPTAVAPTGE